MPHHNDQADIAPLLEQWEGTYKKGLLSFWILLQLSRRPTYAFEMKALIEQLSQGTISADANSLYRALNRFEGMGLIESRLEPSDSGPARRYYHLAPKGARLLNNFIRRNILIFSAPEVSEEIRVFLNSNGSEGER
jgi:PadR family transcriptional regulator PadR